MHRDGRKDDGMSEGVKCAARDALVVGCAISTGIHGALAPAHLREEPAAGIGFLLSTILLAVLCVALTIRPASRAADAAAGALLAGLIVAYGFAVTTGVPVLHPGVEPADRLGLVTKAVELVGLVAALYLAALPARPALRLAHLQTKGTIR